MKKYTFFIKELKTLKKDEIIKAINSYAKREYVIFISLALVLMTTTLIILFKINNTFLVEVPSLGGSITEGIIGTPRFINPVLAQSDPDRDLTELVYSGLMRKGSDGALVPDLAEKYEVSKDELTYTFTLKNRLYFQDNKPLTADDVVFTVTKLKDDLVKSPKALNWAGVNVEKIDDHTVKFELKQPYAAFLENATVGILPYHIWKDVPGDQFSFSDYNINAVGSGPYKITKIKKSSGIPSYYVLKPFSRFALEGPYISKITIKFYPGEKELLKALDSGNIDMAGSITPDKANLLSDNGFNIENTILPRVFGLFFNQNEAPIFTDKNVLLAIDKAINKEAIIKQVLYNYGVPLNGPIPPNLMPYQKLQNETDTSFAGSTDEAIKILEADGWQLNADGVMQKSKSKVKGTDKNSTLLQFSISTGDTPELKQTAEMIKSDLEKIGMRVELKIFDTGNLNQNVIRPRKYDALFFGQIINHPSDLFAFWHSSQRNDPGLNISLYTNARVDKLLEDVLQTRDPNEEAVKYSQIEELVKDDMGGVFVYSPDFIYIVSKNIKGVDLSHVAIPSNRFSSIYKWYIKTDKVWKIFLPK